MQKGGYVYIMTNRPGGTLYIGVTSNLAQRVYQHQQLLVDGFTAKYDCHRLVYYEYCEDINAAILREKQMKKWNRAWKLRLINTHNPAWDVLEVGI